MENLNPDDLFNLDPDTISMITLKNGSILLLDVSAPKKYDTKPNNLKANINDTSKIQLSSFKKVSIAKESSFNFLHEKSNKKFLILDIFSNSFQIINLNSKTVEKNKSIAIDNYITKKQKIRPTNYTDENLETIKLNNDYDNNQNDKYQKFSLPITDRNSSFIKKYDEKRGSNFSDENKNYKNENLMLKDINLDLNKPETTRYNTNNINQNNTYNNNIKDTDNIGHEKITSAITNQQNSTNLNNSHKNQESYTSTINENTSKNTERQKTNNLSKRRGLANKKLIRQDSKHKIKAVITLDILRVINPKINLVRQFNDLVDRINENKNRLKNEEVKIDSNKKYYEMYKSSKTVFNRNNTMKFIGDPFKNKMDYYFSKNNKKRNMRVVTKSDIKDSNIFLSSYTNPFYNTVRVSKSPSYKECIKTRRIKFFL